MRSHRPHLCYSYYWPVDTISKFLSLFGKTASSMIFKMKQHKQQAFVLTLNNNCSSKLYFFIFIYVPDITQVVKCFPILSRFITICFKVGRTFLIIDCWSWQWSTFQENAEIVKTFFGIKFLVPVPLLHIKTKISNLIPIFILTAWQAPESPTKISALSCYLTLFYCTRHKNRKDQRRRTKAVPHKR